MTDLDRALEWWENNQDVELDRRELRRLCGVFAVAARRFASLTSETKVWLCREGEKVHDWAFGVHNEPHCWFNGPTDHNPECGEYSVLRSVEEGTE